jgi:hypothetical protein
MSGETELGLDLPDGGVRGRSAVVVDEGRDGLVPAIDGFDEGCRLGIMLDVDLLEGDALSGHLGLEPLAVPAPHCRVHLHSVDATVPQ